jgi:alpha-ribazole phosphatase
MQYKTIDLLRHGEPSGGNVFRGTTDHPLTDLGWRQLEDVVKGKDWDVIITSPLSRCHAFAKTLAEKSNTPLLLADDLREFDFGIWENQDMDKVFKDDFERLKGMWSDPMNFASPEGESLLNFEARVLKAWFGCLNRPEQKQLIICHGGVIRMLLKEILGLPYPNINRFDVPYASLSRIQASDAEPYSYQLQTHG